MKLITWFKYLALVSLVAAGWCLCRDDRVRALLWLVLATGGLTVYLLRSEDL